MLKDLSTLANDVQMELPPLTQAAAVLNMLIESYRMDEVLDKAAMMDIGIHYSEICQVLFLVKNTIISTAEKIETLTNESA